MGSLLLKKYTSINYQEIFWISKVMTQLILHIYTLVQAWYSILSLFCTTQNFSILYYSKTKCRSGSETYSSLWNRKKEDACHFWTYFCHVVEMVPLLLQCIEKGPIQTDTWISHHITPWHTRGRLSIHFLREQRSCHQIWRANQKRKNISEQH